MSNINLPATTSHPTARLRYFTLADDEFRHRGKSFPTLEEAEAWLIEPLRTLMEQNGSGDGVIFDRDLNEIVGEYNWHPAKGLHRCRVTFLPGAVAALSRAYWPDDDPHRQSPF